MIWQILQKLGMNGISQFRTEVKRDSVKCQELLFEREMLLICAHVYVKTCICRWVHCAKQQWYGSLSFAQPFWKCTFLRMSHEYFRNKTALELVPLRWLAFFSWTFCYSALLNTFFKLQWAGKWYMVYLVLILDYSVQCTSEKYLFETLLE